MARISIRIKDEQKRRLEEASRAQGISESNLVRQALADYLRRQSSPETCLDVARRAGIIGCARDLPPDLSTNPKHFEGFGGG
jgi:metal-responsive CopG/Arc/MetJ family transcriptional regulator